MPLNASAKTIKGNSSPSAMKETSWISYVFSTATKFKYFADHGSQISKLVGSSSASPTRKQTNTPQQRLIRFKKLHDQLQVPDQDYQSLAT